MIDNKFIKKGQRFKSQINNGIIEITDIKVNYLGKVYIYVKDLKTNYTDQTNFEHFKHLLFTPIDNNGREIA